MNFQSSQECEGTEIARGSAVAKRKWVLLLSELGHN